MTNRAAVSIGMLVSIVPLCIVGHAEAQCPSLVFDAPDIYLIGAEATGPVFASGDLDGDGDVDLATVSFDGPKVLLLLRNEGDGQFTQLPPIPTSSYLLDLAFGDVDGDGIMDIAGTPSGSSAALEVLFGVGGGTFEPGFTFLGETGADSQSVILEDFDGDGDLDYAIAHDSDGALAILWNAGDGAVLSELVIPTHEDLWHLTAGHLNQGDSLDLVIALDAVDSLILMFDITVAGPLVETVLTSIGTVDIDQCTRSPQIADLNGDGSNDLAFVQQGSELVVAMNDGSGQFTSAVAYPIATGSVPPDFLRLGDLDLDGDLDLAFGSSQTGSTWVGTLLNDGEGNFGMSGSIGVGAKPQGVVLADLDADGDIDLATKTSGSSVTVHANLCLTPPPPPEPCLGDLNGDGLVNSIDLNVFLALFGSSCGPSAASDAQRGRDDE